MTESQPNRTADPQPAAETGTARTDAPDGQAGGVEAAGTRAGGVEAAGTRADDTGPTAGNEAAELLDRWQRAQAELENTRKRYERQLADLSGAERARVAAEWLPVLDNLDRALGHAGADPRSILEGVEAVREQALAVLERLGVVPFDGVGTRFDPSRHEAAQVVDAPDAEPGTVVAVFRPGYTGADGLLRPAVVAVAGKPD
jgi:molecular chaperone GrpE